MTVSKILDRNGRLFGKVSIIDVLVVLVVQFVHPWALLLALAVPPVLTYALLLVLTADAFLSALVLRRGGDVELMSLRNLLRALET